MACECSSASSKLLLPSDDDNPPNIYNEGCPRRNASIMEMAEDVAVVDKMVEQHGLSVDEELDILDVIAKINSRNSVEETALNSTGEGNGEKISDFIGVSRNPFTEDLFYETDVGIVDLAYRNFCSMTSLKLIPVDELLLGWCCGSRCGMKFSPYSVMQARLIFPVIRYDKATMFTTVNNIYYGLARPFCKNHTFLPFFKEVPVCQTFFRRVYGIPQCRLDKFILEATMGCVQSHPHATLGRKIERNSIIERTASIANTVAKFAEPQPNGTGYMMPPSMTRTDLIKKALPGIKYKINVTRELHRLKSTLHFEKSNSLMKCNTCVQYKFGLMNNWFRDDSVETAKKMLREHHRDVMDDRRDYALRKEVSREGDSMLSIAHDGMSKEQSKYPHQRASRTKAIADGELLTCTLTMAVIHKHSRTKKKRDRLCCFWNVCDTCPMGTNMNASQILTSLLAADRIPKTITIQLDNCPSNKSYKMLAVFAMLLIWIPEIKQIFICMSEVGHTHIDIDGFFGQLAAAWASKEIATPQAFQRFVSAHFDDSVEIEELFPTVYDFTSLFQGNLVTSGELKKNHLFELILDEQGTPIVRVARYVRSEQFLTTNKCPDASFPIFKTVPSPTDIPDILDDFEFNMTRHNKVLERIKGCMSLADYADFVDVPRLFAERKKVPFNDLLNQIRQKVLRLPERPQAVPTTQSPKEWLLNPHIWKEWAPESVRNNFINAAFPGTCGNAEQDAEEPSESAAKDAEEPPEPPVKKRRGRPRKNP